MEALSVFLIVGLSFSLMLLMKRLANTGFAKPAEVLPTIMLAIIAVELFYGWLYGSKVIVNLPHLIRLNTPLVFLIGPVIYLMVKTTRETSLTWKEISWLHLLPFFLAIIYLMPLYSASAAEKLEYMNAMYISLPFDSILLGGLRRLHQGIYISLAVIMIFQNKADARFMKELRPVLIIVILFTLLWLVSIYRYFFQFDLQTGYIDISLLAMASIILVYKQMSASKRIKYMSQVVDQEKAEELKVEIINLIEQEKLFLNPKLSIQDFAQRLKMPNPIISMVINQHLGTNFNELINKYRIEEAIRLLQKEDSGQLTMEVISENSGFNSTSSFNSNFKRVTGKSPKHFKMKV